MDAARFDRLARSLSQPSSRRQTLLAFAGGGSFACQRDAGGKPFRGPRAACITRADCPAEGGARVGPSEDDCIFAP